MRRQATLPTLLAGLVLLAGCRDDRGPVGPTEGGPSSQANQNGSTAEQRDLRTMDERFTDLNRQIPGFGGYFRGESGDFVVYLTHPATQQAVARQVLTSILAVLPIPARLNLTAPPQILVREGQYTFAQLDQLRYQARDALLGTEGFVSIGVHPAENRVFIGVRDTAARDRVQTGLARANLAAEAFIVRVVGQGRLTQGTLTLRDQAPTIWGGFQIDMAWGEGGECTLGFNTTWNGSPAFLTASHCTAIQSGEDGTVFSQPTRETRRIGAEVRDPSWFTRERASHRCPESQTDTPIYCRWSDVAVIGYDAGIAQERGYIARTTFSSTFEGDSGSIVVDPIHPRFRIAQVLYSSTAGDPVEKMGRTRGWTWGKVEIPCQDIDLATFGRPGYWLLCQDYATYRNASGDSGSPVFLLLGSAEAGLQGIQWGRLDSNGSFLYSLYSPIFSIEIDLGPLDYFP